ncbi:MAG: hypothetical protein NC409_01245 [Clostridium sp.]|nr:hypothetical protein [Clostridium sp.]
MRRSGRGENRDGRRKRQVKGIRGAQKRTAQIGSATGAGGYEMTERERDGQ